MTYHYWYQGLVTLCRHPVRDTAVHVTVVPGFLSPRVNDEPETLRPRWRPQLSLRSPDRVWVLPPRAVDKSGPHPVVSSRFRQRDPRSYGVVESWYPTPTRRPDPRSLDFSCDGIPEPMVPTLTRGSGFKVEGPPPCNPTKSVTSRTDEVTRNPGSSTPTPCHRWTYPLYPTEDPSNKGPPYLNDVESTPYNVMVQTFVPRYHRSGVPICLCHRWPGGSSCVRSSPRPKVYRVTSSSNRMFSTPCYTRGRNLVTSIHLRSVEGFDSSPWNSWHLKRSPLLTTTGVTIIPDDPWRTNGKGGSFLRKDQDSTYSLTPPCPPHRSHTVLRRRRHTRVWITNTRWPKDGEDDMRAWEEVGDTSFTSTNK